MIFFNRHWLIALEEKETEYTIGGATRLYKRNRLTNYLQPNVDIQL